MAETRTIEILSDTNCDRQRVRAGAIVEASLKDAKFLINTKKARAVVAAEPEVDDAPKRGRRRAPVNRMIETGDLENRDAGE